MKVSRAQMAQNREKIVESASRLFRAKGFDAVTVADVMAAAGLTHGGFYGHFPSKDALIAEAIARGPDLAAPDLKSLAKAYLTPAHRDAREKGCAFAALGSEVARLPAEARHAMTESLKSLLSAMADEKDPARRRWAIAGWAAMVGALTLSRLSADPAFSDEILRETRRAFGAA